MTERDIKLPDKEGRQHQPLNVILIEDQDRQRQLIIEGLNGSSNGNTSMFPHELSSGDVASSLDTLDPADVDLVIIDQGASLGEAGPFVVREFLQQVKTENKHAIILEVSGAPYPPKFGRITDGVLTKATPQYNVLLRLLRSSHEPYMVREKIRLYSNSARFEAQLAHPTSELNQTKGLVTSEFNPKLSMTQLMRILERMDDDRLGVNIYEIRRTLSRHIVTAPKADETSRLILHEGWNALAEMQLDDSLLATQVPSWNNMLKMIEDLPSKSDK